MVLQLLNPGNYVLNVYALPMLIVAAAIAALGIFAVIREHGSRTGVYFLLSCLSVGLYLFATGMNYESRDDGTSLLWLRISQFGSVYIPSTALLMTATILGLSRRYRAIITASIVASTVFAIGVFFTDLHVAGSSRFFWGRFVQYGPLGFAFIGFFLLVFIVIFRFFWREYRQTATERQRKRLSGLLIAFCIGSLGAIDFIPAAGISVYPFGYIPIFFFLIVGSYVVIQYRLVDITPEMAADQILETIQGAVVVTDLEGKIRVINRVALDMLGYQKPELLGKELAVIIPSLAKLGNAIGTGERAVFHEMTWYSRTGRRFDVSASASSIADTRDGSSIGIVYAAYDVTERKLTEESLKRSEEENRALVNAVPDLLFRIDRFGTIRDYRCSDALDLFLPPEAFMGKRIQDILPAHISDAAIEMMRRVLATGKSSSFEYALDLRGEAKFYDNRIVRLNNEETLHVIRDITDRKRAEEALRSHEERLRLAMEAAQQGWFDLNVQTGEVIVSPEYVRIIGYEPDDFKTSVEDWLDNIHPEDRAIALKAYRECLETGDTRTMEYRRRTKNGEWKWIRSIGKIVGFDANKKPLRMIGTHTDISERKRAEEALRHSEEMTRNVLDSVDEGFIVVDRDYRILTANRAYCKQNGVSQDEVVGKNCFALSHKVGRPCYEAGEECAVRQVFETGAPSIVYHSHRDADGNTIHVETKAFPLKDASGNVSSVIESISNITEKHLLEQERLKMQKLEAIGTLAGGIAHDFNNLLQGVFGYISLAKLTAYGRQKSLSTLEQAEKALHMAVKLTNQLLTFSKGGKPVKRPIDLLPMIDNAAQFALSGSRSDYRITADEELWQVEADEGQIGQVIQNIVLNADQAMTDGGRVEITVRNVHVPHQNVLQGLRTGRHVQVTITDTGIGIPEKDIARIFDPYFTTKEKGSGLGLATSYSIMKNHGGMLDVKSEVGKGTTFFIYLPAIAASPPAAFVQPPHDLSPVRCLYVLIMDDEPVIRDVAGELIRALGHEVDFSADGEEALEKYRLAKQSGKPFDLVILDLTIRGGMGGAETMGKLREIDPGVRAIVSSGYSDDDIVSNHEKQGFKAFLKKPYNADELRKVLDKALTT